MAAPGSITDSLHQLSRRPDRIPLNAIPTCNLQSGVTLLELMIVLSIAAILAALAAPSFNNMLNSTRQSSASLQLISDLNHARSEAIKRNNHVLVCITDGVAMPNTNCLGGANTNWNAGWIVCADADNDGSCDAATASQPSPIDIRPALSSKLTLTGSGSRINFSPNGSSGTAATLTLGGTWSGATSRVITVALTGNISKQ